MAAGLPPNINTNADSDFGEVYVNKDMQSYINLHHGSHVLCF